jgi:predicted sulfurtransferase
VVFNFLNKNYTIFQIKCKNLGFNFNNKKMLNFKDKLLYESHISWQIKLQLKELMSQKNDFVIIDVRELNELEGGIIEDSIHMPLGLCIRNAKKKQIEDMKDKKICTYCGTGLNESTCLL